MSKLFDIALMKKKKTGEAGVTQLLPDGGVMV